MSDGVRKISVHDLERGPAPMPGVIAPGARVTLHFSLALSNGETVDSNFDKAPVTFTIGDGSMLPGFEEALCGLRAGERGEFTLAPERAFGAVNEDNVQRFPLYQFPPDLALSPGLMLEFGDAAGNMQAGMVRGSDKQWVDVDFNHPLAGRAIRFHVHVHDVQAKQTP